jgi:hypothetical protein
MVHKPLSDGASMLPQYCVGYLLFGPIIVLLRKSASGFLEIIFRWSFAPAAAAT